MSGVSKYGLPRDITDNFLNVMAIPFPDFFSPSFSEYVWEKRMISVNNAKPNDINTNEFFIGIEKEYVNTSTGQLRTRFQAFVEALELKIAERGEQNG